MNTQLDTAAAATDQGPAAARPKVLVVLALVAGLAVGVGLTLVLSGGDGGTTPVEPVSADASTRDGDPEALAGLPDPDPIPDPADASDPESALRGFLASEAAGEWERSYAFLTAAARATAFPSVAEWVNAHADFPTITAYRVDDVVDNGDGTATARTLTGYEPVVDPVLGLVPARGRTTWTLEAEDGAWRVEATVTETRFLYPGSVGADDAAERWVMARTDCADTSAVEADLVGSPRLATLLCEEDQPRPPALGEPRGLADADGVTALLSEFGPEVYNWARVVDVDAATPLRLVLGPVGEEWQVVGVLARL